MCAALLAACATSTPIAVSVESPQTFDAAASGAPAQWPAQDWFHGFASAELDGLIAQAQANNLDLLAAAARVRQADAHARAAGAALLPQLDVAGDSTTLAGRSAGDSAHETDWSALLTASYEADFWGRNRAVADSAQAATIASQADRDTLALTIVASVTNSYFQVLSLRERSRVARDTLESTRRVLEAVQQRYDAGVATAVEVATQKAAVANAQLAIDPLRQQEAEARGALALLVGRAPEGFVISTRALDDLHEPGVAPGLPSELLTRRPDVYSAEANLRAAHADLTAARAALFPSITLTGGAGAQNPSVQAAVITLEGTGASLSLGAALVQSIFDRGRRRAERDVAAAREQELLVAYRSTILNALLDVENALGAIQHLDRQRPAHDENVRQSQRALEGAQLRYREGAGDYLTVLDAQRTLYAAREQYSQYKLARLQAVVGLCRALGGGWQQGDRAVAAQSE